MSGCAGRCRASSRRRTGIGAAIAGQLATDGPAVAVVDPNEQAAGEAAAAIREKGGRAVPVPADVTDRMHVQAVVNRAVAEFGGLHFLVNNAGVARDNLLFKMTAADWATVMAVHLQGAFLMTQLTQIHMVKARYGRIISLSSASALGNRGQANYSAAKAGIQGSPGTLEIKLGPFGRPEPGLPGRRRPRLAAGMTGATGRAVMAASRTGGGCAGRGSGRP